MWTFVLCIHSRRNLVSCLRFALLLPFLFVLLFFLFSIFQQGQQDTAENLEDDDCFDGDDLGAVGGGGLGNMARGVQPAGLANLSEGEKTVVAVLEAGGDILRSWKFSLYHFFNIKTFSRAISSISARLNKRNN